MPAFGGSETFSSTSSRDPTSKLGGTHGKDASTVASILRSRSTEWIAVLRVITKKM